MIQKELVKYAIKEICKAYNKKVNILLIGFDKAKGEDMYNITLAVSIAKIGISRISIDNLDMSLESGLFYKEWIEYSVKKRIDKMLMEYIGLGDEE